MTNKNSASIWLPKTKLSSCASLLSQYKYKRKDSVSSYPSKFMDIELHKRGWVSCVYVRFNWPKPIWAIFWGNVKDLPVLIDPSKGSEEHTDATFIFDRDITDALNFLRDQL